MYTYIYQTKFGDENQQYRSKILDGKYLEQTNLLMKTPNAAYYTKQKVTNHFAQR